MDACEVLQWDLMGSYSSVENSAYTVSQMLFSSIYLVTMATLLTSVFDQGIRREVCTFWYPLKTEKFHF